MRGHAQPVTSLNIHSSPPNTLVTGAADRRVRVFDTRRGSQPAMTLSGHQGAVVSTQCDDWKVASGGKDGLVVVWDRRMSGELWSSHERHPVARCWFTSRYLVAAHLPQRRRTDVVSGAAEPLHRCHRGLLRVMDFSVDPLYYTRLLPSVCSSGYDEPSRSFYHLDLKLPYDTIS
ncbi:F-box/WD repeat-containing protein 8 [Geodia barretti]|nr:F-box/WD repeat-containing protein 8 [Geodia barretti]